MSDLKPSPKPPIEPSLTPRALNAVRHGIFSVSPVIPWFESEDDWIAFRDGIIDSLKPQDALQDALAENIASTIWRRLRVIRYEREATASSIENVRRDYETHALVTGQPIPSELTPELQHLLENLAMQRLVPDDDTLNRIMRYETKLHRYLLQTLHQYFTLRDGVRAYRPRRNRRAAGRNDVEMTDIRRVAVRSPRLTRPEKHH
jgi:hypothetical protein